MRLQCNLKRPFRIAGHGRERSSILFAVAFRLQLFDGQFGHADDFDFIVDDCDLGRRWPRRCDRHQKHVERGKFTAAAGDIFSLSAILQGQTGKSAPSWATGWPWAMATDN